LKRNAKLKYSSFAMVVRTEIIKKKSISSPWYANAVK
jgi:hypothetical protein